MKILNEIINDIDFLQTNNPNFLKKYFFFLELYSFSLASFDDEIFRNNRYLKLKNYYNVSNNFNNNIEIENFYLKNKDKFEKIMYEFLFILSNIFIKHSKDRNKINKILVNLLYPIIEEVKYCKDLNAKILFKIYLTKFLNNLNIILTEIQKNNHLKIENLIYEELEEIIYGYINNDIAIDFKKNEELEELKKLISNLNISDADNAFEELENLTGLLEVKNEVKNLINFVKIRNLREKNGLKVSPMSFHLLFTGNPGTGKTTVARIIAKIYKELNLISKGHLIEADRSNLVAAYLGQTAIKVQEVVEQALGGVLFIDEAYSLYRGENDSYGQEAIDTLLKLMEDNRDDLVVIVAGYYDLMEQFLQSNPGLKSRFNRFIDFKDYTPIELVEIFLKLCVKSGYKLEENSYEKLLCNLKYLQNSTSDFGNGRGVRNYFEKVIINQANRIVAITTPKKEDIILIKEKDL